MGKLTKERYKEVITLHPKIQDEIKTGIYEYNDKMLNFIKRSMKQIPYFEHLASDDPILYDIIYLLDTKTMIKGEQLSNAGDDANELFFLQSGMIEVYMEFEGKEFVVERLFKGSIVNYRTFFMYEKGAVSMRFAAPSVLKALSNDKMNFLVAKHPTLGSRFQKYRLKVVTKTTTIPLDYVMALPKKISDQLIRDTRRKLLNERQDQFVRRVRERKEQHLSEKGLEMSDQQLKQLHRQLKEEIVPEDEVKNDRRKINLLENKLKNIVVRQIVKIREERNKQTIKEAVDAILRENREMKDKRSKKVEKYVKREFEEAAARNMGNDGDFLYNRVIFNMKRLLKVLTGHSAAIDSLERKLREISAPKKKKKTMLNSMKVIANAAARGYERTVQLNRLIEDQLDDEGMDDFVEPATPPEYQDEIDILSEGQMEREIMMEQIRMVEID